jgi:hypothetical protein
MSEEYNHRKLDELCIQEKWFATITTVPSKAPYQMSYRKAQNSKPHIAETVIEMVQCLVKNMLNIKAIK